MKNVLAAVAAVSLAFTPNLANAQAPQSATAREARGGVPGWGLYIPPVIIAILLVILAADGGRPAPKSP